MITPDYIDIDQKASSDDKFYHNMFALIKLRAKGTNKLRKLPSGVFRCLLEYCKPMVKYVSKHCDDYAAANRPINFAWPEQLSYENPVTAVQCDGEGLFFRLLSGEKTNRVRANDFRVDGFKDLNWSQIASLAIIYYPQSAFVVGFEFYNSEEKLIQIIGYNNEQRTKFYKINLRQNERVVGIQANKSGAHYENLQLIIMGPL